MHYISTPYSIIYTQLDALYIHTLQYYIHTARIFLYWMLPLRHACKFCSQLIYCPATMNITCWQWSAFHYLLLHINYKLTMHLIKNHSTVLTCHVVQQRIMRLSMLAPTPPPPTRDRVGNFPCLEWQACPRGWDIESLKCACATHAATHDQ